MQGLRGPQGELGELGPKGPPVSTPLTETHANQPILSALAGIILPYSEKVWRALNMANWLSVGISKV